MWRPQNGTVFVRKDADKTVTEGGIVLPTTQAELTLAGEVALSSSVDYPVGLRVLFSKFAGSEVKVGSESLLIMRVEDILATWREE